MDFKGKLESTVSFTDVIGTVESKESVNKSDSDIWYFTLDYSKIKNRQEDEFSSMSDVEILMLVKHGKCFYENYKYNCKFGINKQVYKLWKGTAGVGKYFREFIAAAPLVVVMTQLINERMELKKCFVDDDFRGADSFMAILLGGLRGSESGDSFEEKKYKYFLHDCHVKRFGFIKYYFKCIFKDCDFERIVSDLKNYDDIYKVYLNIKNEMYLN